MRIKTQTRLHRRRLLSGIAAVAALAVVQPVARTVFDRIVIRDGWLLRESDLS